VEEVPSVPGLYEIISPYHSSKLRVCRGFGDFFMKWKLKDDIDENEGFTCTETKGSYRHPVIQVSSSSLPPRFLTLLPPSKQPVSCEPVLTLTQRSLERYEEF
jgi:hypothetical protein